MSIEINSVKEFYNLIKMQDDCSSKSDNSNNADLSSKLISKDIKNDLVIVYFWAPWCGPCKRFAPEYESYADKSSIIMKKINIDVEDLSELAVNYGIQSIPTLIAFRKGIEIGREIGVPESLDKFVSSFQ